MFSMRSFLQYLSMTGRRRWSRVLENVFSKRLQKSKRATRLYWRPRQPKWARSRKREQARLLPNRKWSGQGRYKSVTTDHSGFDSFASEKIGCTAFRGAAIIEPKDNALADNLETHGAMSQPECARRCYRNRIGQYIQQVRPIH